MGQKLDQLVNSINHMNDKQKEMDRHTRQMMQQQKSQASLDSGPEEVKSTNRVTVPPVLPNTQRQDLTYTEVDQYQSQMMSATTDQQSSVSTPKGKFGDGHRIKNLAKGVKNVFKSDKDQK